MTRYHSPIGHAAYHDLRRLLMDDQASELRGKPIRVTINHRRYWYDQYRLGQKVVKRYIGEDIPEVRNRLSNASMLRQQDAARRAEKTRLVRLLRAEGYASTDSRTGSLLSAFARAGVFRLGGTLVGTVAFKLYEGELGVVLGADRMAHTDDVDIASFERLSFALGDEVSEPLAQVLKQFDFEAVPSLDSGKVWRWKQAGRETLVEFLPPAFGSEGLRDLPALGVSAQALNHLNFLIAEPIKAVALYRSGVLVQIPRPERYAIHKLIVADRRKSGSDSLKSVKDRAQAAFLIDVLAEDRPDELTEAWTAARAQGPKWRARLDASLSRMPETRERLEALDPI